MKKKSNQTNCFNIETIQEKEQGIIVGGFSESIHSLSDTTKHKPDSAINRKGGNCVSGCGKNKKTKPAKGTNSNCGGNCVKGCGN